MPILLIIACILLVLLLISMFADNSADVVAAFGLIVGAVATGMLTVGLFYFVGPVFGSWGIIGAILYSLFLLKSDITKLDGRPCTLKHVTFMIVCGPVVVTLVCFLIILVNGSKLVSYLWKKLLQFFDWIAK